MKHELLFSCLYGSRLYGTQTPTSDKDIKHIVLPDITGLILGKKLENKVKKTNTLSNTKNSADDIDEEFIPIQIFARHFIEGQTYAIELAYAIDGVHAEQKIHNKLFKKFIHELRSTFLTSNIKSMMGYVVNQANIYSLKGERLNVSRELLNIFKSINSSTSNIGEIYDNNDKFRKDISDLSEKYPKYFHKTEYDVGGNKMRLCLTVLEKTLPFSISIDQAKKVLETLINKYGSRADSATEKNVDWKATMHAIRIVDEGVNILSNYKLSFPFDPKYASYLLSIKNGNIDIEYIRNELSSKLEILKDLEKTCKLPTADIEFKNNFDDWMVKWMLEFYSLKRDVYFSESL